jgi:arsenate reductase
VSDLKLYFNPQCSKCRQALCELEPRKPEIVEYLKNAPSEAELLALMRILEGEPSELVRTKEQSYRENPFPLDDRSVIARELAKRPDLLERPIVVYRGRAVVARPVERMKILFG